MAIVVDYVTVRDLGASPGNTWYAQFSPDLGNNYGWTFTQPGDVTVRQASIQDLGVTPLGEWYAVGSTDVSNNDGWIFNTAGVISVSFCSIKDLEGLAPALWLAYASDGNQNAGNNVNWRFNPPGGGSLALFFP
jgi:hypothetical protein